MKTWHENDLERLTQFLRDNFPDDCGPFIVENAVDVVIALLTEYFKPEKS
ncbi:MAG: hypothetical protein KKD18_02820 [Nanoarchaeota archaeon]|nr:hypothetical protein [Nanoarchaeota archaeon]